MRCGDGVGFGFVAGKRKRRGAIDFVAEGGKVIIYLVNGLNG